MFEHLKVLSLVLQLLAGSWIISYIIQVYSKYDYRYLILLGKYMIALNMAFFAGMVIAYIHLNMESEAGFSGHLWYRLLPGYIVSVFSLLLVYYSARIIFSLRNLRFPRSADLIVFALIFILGSSYLIRSLFPVIDPAFRVFDRVRSVVFENLIVLEPLILGMGLVRVKGKRPSPRLVSLSLLLLSRYFLTGILVVLNFVWHMNDTTRFILASFLILFFNFIPYLWIHYFFLPYATSLSRTIETRGDLDRIFQKFGISTREREITLLILSGHSNTQIGDSLFISPHTVKNHIFNIFRKFDVGSRYELIQVFLRF